MVWYGQVASMQEPAFNITTSSFIDIPATLLQSEPAGAANGTFLTVVCCLAAIAGWVIWRRRLTQVPRDASGRLPQDALLGVVAMMLFYVAGALGALVIGERMDPSDPYGRLARGALGNAAQVALAVALIRSPLFVDAERPPARPRDALAAGGIGFLLALPIVLALGAAIGLLMTALGFPPRPRRRTRRCASCSRRAKRCSPFSPSHTSPCLFRLPKRQAGAASCNHRFERPGLAEPARLSRPPCCSQPSIGRSCRPTAASPASRCW